MKAVLFDLDNTLYPPDRDLFSLIDVRINRFMEEVISIDADDVDRLRRRYWRDYGATLQGLIRHHEVDPEDYLDYIHAVDVGSRLSHDEDLHTTLKGLPIPSYVFTNGSRCHVDRVIKALGLEGLFSGVFDIRIADYKPKPSPDPYHQVLEALGLEGGQCIMVEDQHENLATAKQFGMKTILVGGCAEADRFDYIDARVTCSTEAGSVVESWVRSADG